MPIGISAHLGLNNLSKQGYGEPATLVGAENDAREMMAIASARGFRPDSLIATDANADVVRSRLTAYANDLSSGDSLLLTFSGHGRQIEDTNGDEPYGLDQTWCLYERMLIDDEIYSKLSNFQRGVRILVISDSCHSGSVIELSPRVKRLPDAACSFSLERNSGVYARMRLPPGPRKPVEASVILLAACQDDQTASDGDPNGLFTQILLQVWDRGRFSGSLRGFFEAIRSRMPRDQTPNWYPLGPRDSAFEAAPPFSR